LFENGRMVWYPPVTTTVTLPEDVPEILRNVDKDTFVAYHTHFFTA